MQALRASLEGASVSAMGTLIPVTGRAVSSVLRVLDESERVVTAGTSLIELGNSAGLEVVSTCYPRMRARPFGHPRSNGGMGRDRPLWGRVRMVEPAAFTEG